LTVAGDVSLKPLGSDLLVAGARAWLVQDDRGVGVILHHGLNPDNYAAEITTEWRNLATAESSPIASGIGSAAEYFQPSMHTWYYIYQPIEPMDASGAGPFCELRGLRNGDTISIGMDRYYCSMFAGVYEGISLPSHISLQSRVLRESDPFLMRYYPGGGGFPPEPFTMNFEQRSSTGESQTTTSAFESADGCYDPGFNGFPVSRFGLSTELIITGVGVCRDPDPFPDALLVEGHLVTGG
ncbi:MAG: hypothetical protein GXP55_26580, partial [Deltaproteobacteria bacterium]|nr:hypothetical protein [Deltaproteobacteria bacterium]